MRLNIYSIKDQKAEVYGQPFYQSADGEATRTLHQLTNDEKSMQYKYPDDYDLYRLGIYDDNTGLFIPETTPIHIAKASALKKV